MGDEKTDLFGLGNVEMRMRFVTDLVTYLREKYGDDACGSSVMPEPDVSGITGTERQVQHR